MTAQTMQRLLYIITIVFGLFPSQNKGYAQDDSSESQIQRALLDESPWASTRASAMAGAISPIANGLDASHYNPAGIGGITDEGKRPGIHRLYFPYFSAAVNEDTVSLNDELTKAGDLTDPNIASQILRAYQDKRQYGRFSIVPSITFWRTQLSYVYDTQMAAAATDSTTDLVDIHARTVTGPSIGFSFATDSKDFTLGIYSGFFQRTETKGTYTLAEVNDPDARSSIFSADETKYDGMPINFGINWVIAKKWRPSLALVFRNAGGTKYRNSDSSAEDMVVDEDMTLGFSISPKLGKWGYLSWVVEAGNLTNSEMATSKKAKTSLEFTIGDRFGGNAGLSLRTGYNNAGLSYGLGSNLGILGLNASSFAEDVGYNNRRVIERRFVVNFAVNIADF